MCGIVGAIAERNVTEILLEGLKRLEYRGYDSAGIALLAPDRKTVKVHKTAGKVSKLVERVQGKALRGHAGIAHTRWATHGKPTNANAHPHSSSGQIAIVHNGIIENFEKLREKLTKSRYQFATQTDSEVIAHLIHLERKGNNVSLFDATQKAIRRLEGAYGICIADAATPDELIVARSGSPLVIGVGIGENFIASDPHALGQVTDQFIYLEEGDIARITRENYEIWQDGKQIKRKVNTVASRSTDGEKGTYKHFMLKEIYEQPAVIRDTLDGRISKNQVLENAFGVKAPAIFDKVKHVQFVACGTSYHACHVAKYCHQMGMDVVGIDDMSGGFLANVPPDIKFIEADIRDPKKLEPIFAQHKFTYVYHMAAYAAEGLSHFVRSFNYRVNLLGSVELLNLSIKHDVNCFVFASSIAVYGSQLDLVKQG